MKSAFLIGAALMVAAMQVAPVTDALAKMLVVQWEHSAMQVAWARSLLQAVALAPLALSFRNAPSLSPTRSRDIACAFRCAKSGLKKHGPRGLCWAGATLFFFLSLEDNPLPSALALLFVAPAAVAALAPLTLGEKVRASDAVAIVAGFGGAVLVLKPGGDFSPTLLFALAAGLCYAGYLLFTRRAAEDAAARTVFFAAAVSALVMTPLALWHWKTPAAAAVGIALAMGGLSAFAHWLIARACVFAPASALAPLLYTEIVGAAVVSWVLLSEFPDAVAWGGIAVIIVSGTYVSAARVRRDRSEDNAG